MSASEIRRKHRKLIAEAEARAAADVALGITNLKAAVDKTEWPWERQPLEHAIARFEAVDEDVTVDPHG